MTELKVTRDKKGVVSYGINFSDTGKIISMAAAATANLTIPAGADFALFQVQPGATALIGAGSSAITAPTASFTDETADINPAGRSLYGETTLQFYAVDAAIIKVSFYAVRA